MLLPAIVGCVLLTGVAIASIYVLGMRAKSPVVQGPLIRLQRAVINPRQLRHAGSPGASASVIRHVGRVSGQPYEQPVGVVTDGDSFVIGLPYGTRTNWLRNVLAAGTATIRHEGTEYAVDQPELVPMRAVESLFSRGDRRSFRWFRVDQALRLRRRLPAHPAQPADEEADTIAGAATSVPEDRVA